MILWWILACGGGGAGGSVQAALEPWPDEPEALLQICGELAFPELAVTCRVQAAARFAQRGDSEGAERACALVPAGTCAEECHFRAGEELGRHGHTTQPLRHCREAGWFARNCLTHTAWGLPADPELTSASDPKLVQQSLEEVLS